MPICLFSVIWLMRLLPTSRFTPSYYSSHLLRQGQPPYDREMPSTEYRREVEANSTRSEPLIAISETCIS